MGAVTWSWRVTCVSEPRAHCCRATDGKVKGWVLVLISEECLFRKTNRELRRGPGMRTALNRARDKSRVGLRAQETKGVDQGPTRIKGSSTGG